jgi:4,5-DOPA dioxygenase extradiol
MDRQPTLFVSHGAPTFALDAGIAGPRLAALGRVLERPAAVLVVSPHWMTPTPRVGTAARPQTIHDFGGFDAALYEVTYPAPGHAALAQRAIEVLRGAGWSAQADVPVFQVSLPARLDGDSAWAFGRALRPLSDEGVLIVGSGSITHNLYEFRTGHADAEGYAAEFAAWVREAVALGDGERLRRTLDLAPHAQRAHPTAEHFWPLLVAAGAAAAPLPATTIEGGIMHGMLVMDSFVFGATPAAPPNS